MRHNWPSLPRDKSTKNGQNLFSSPPPPLFLSYSLYIDMGWYGRKEWKISKKVEFFLEYTLILLSQYNRNKIIHWFLNDNYDTLYEQRLSSLSAFWNIDSTPTLKWSSKFQTSLTRGRVAQSHACTHYRDFALFAFTTFTDCPFLFSLFLLKSRSYSLKKSEISCKISDIFWIISKSFSKLSQYFSIFFSLSSPFSSPLDLKI